MRYKALAAPLLLLTGFALGNFCTCRRAKEAPEPPVIVRVDTVRIVTPEPVVVKYIGREVIAVARADIHAPVDSCPDSAVVELPRTQALCAGEGYRAYVSGVRPRLDSLVFERPVAVVAQPPKRWSVGIQAGAGITPAGVQPYIGIGVSFRIF